MSTTAWAKERKPTNQFHVPLKQWKKWTVVGKHVFNKLYDHSIKNPWLYHHPEQTTVLDKHWKTVAWNHAWMAADIASRGENALLETLVRDIRGWDRYGRDDEELPRS